MRDMNLSASISPSNFRNTLKPLILISVSVNHSNASLIKLIGSVTFIPSIAGPTFFSARKGSFHSQSRVCKTMQVQPFSPRSSLGLPIWPPLRAGYASVFGHRTGDCSSNYQDNLSYRPLHIKIRGSVDLPGIDRRSNDKLNRRLRESL